MATWARRDTTTGSTSNVASYASASFTPTADDLLVVVVQVTGSPVSNVPTMTSSANGITYTLIERISTNAAINAQNFIYVADQKVPASPSAMTVTFALTGGETGTGCNIVVMAGIGMLRVGLAAVRQFKHDDAHVGGNTPTLTLDKVPLTTNSLFGAAANVTGTGSSVTQPSSWTENAELAYSTPTKGTEVCTRASGASSATVTWGSTMSAGGIQVVEFDASPPFSGWGVPI